MGVGGVKGWGGEVSEYNSTHPPHTPTHTVGVKGWGGVGWGGERYWIVRV